MWGGIDMTQNARMSTCEINRQKRGEEKFMKKPVIFVVVLGLLMLTASFASAASESRHRVGIFGGYFMPNGEFEHSYPSNPNRASWKAPFDAGSTFGVDYRFLLPSNLTVGAFLERNSFSGEQSETSGSRTWKSSVDVTTDIIGVSVGYEHKLAKMATVYGAGKLGYASSTISLDSQHTNAGNTYKVSCDTTGTSYAAILEVGVRFPITDLLDLGIAGRYYHIPMSPDYGKDANVGGMAVVGTIGFNF
jgi:opacity protein-like surface antigen